MLSISFFTSLVLKGTRPGLSLWLTDPWKFLSQSIHYYADMRILYIVSENYLEPAVGK